MGMLLYTTTVMRWEWECGHGNGREWDQRSHSRTSLLSLILNKDGLNVKKAGIASECVSL